MIWQALKLKMAPSYRIVEEKRSPKVSKLINFRDAELTAAQLETIFLLNNQVPKRIWR
jgi:hypothetical protein